MSVRRRRWRNPSTEAVKEASMVDVKAIGKDGVRRRIRRVAPVRNRRVAERLEHELRQQLLNADERNVTQPVEIPLFGAFVERFVATYVATNNKPSEAESKKSIFRLHLVPAFGHLRLAQIGPGEIEVYEAQKLQAKLAAKTINNHLTVLRKLLATAVEWGLIDTVPVMRWLKLPPQEFRFLTFEEADRLIEAADDEWRVMIIVALRTGLRLGELLALRWVDVDLVAGRLVVRRAVARGVVGAPKNGRMRAVPLSAQAQQALENHPRRGETVFSQADGSMLSKGACKRPLWRAGSQAGVGRLGWHVLRHSFASHLVMRGAPLKTVQERLGHITIEMTMRYAHLSPDARREAVRLLDVKESVTLTWRTASGEVLPIPVGRRRPFLSQAVLPQSARERPRTTQRTPHRRSGWGHIGHMSRVRLLRVSV